MKFIPQFLKQMAFIVTVIGIAIPALAQDTVMFNYQGRVKVHRAEFEGQGKFKFAILSPNGVTTLWSNDSTSVDGSEPTTGLDIPVTDGVFNVLMGANDKMDPINSTIFQIKRPLKLRTWFSDGINGFQALHPDHNLINMNLITSQTGGNDFTIYVNGQSGADSNSGLKPGQAKKTIQAAVDIVPSRIMANVIIDIADGVYPEEVLIYGLACRPGKTLKLQGDTDWTPAKGGAPKVVITGADGATSGVRSYALNATQCTGVEIIGVSCQNTSQCGINLDNGSYKVQNCHASDNEITGMNFSMQSFVEAINIFSKGNGYHGIGINVNSRASLTSCTAIENKMHGMVCMDQSSAVMHGTGVFSQNGACGIYALSSAAVNAFNDFHGVVQNNKSIGIYAGLNAYYSNFVVRSIITGNSPNISSGGGGNTNY